MPLTYTEQDRQRLIVRQTCLKAATEIISKDPREWSSEDVISHIKQLTDAFEKIVLDEVQSS